MKKGFSRLKKIKSLDFESLIIEKTSIFSIMSALLARQLSAKSADLSLSPASKLQHEISHSLFTGI